MHNLEVQTNRAADPKICQGYDSVFIHPESKQSTDINSQGTTDTTHVNFIIIGKMSFADVMQWIALISLICQMCIIVKNIKTQSA